MTGQRTVPAPFLGVLRAADGPDGLAELRGAVGDWLVEAGLGARAVEELLVAVSEACANAWEHSGARDEWDRPAGRVEAAVFADRVQVRVVDHGRWRTPDAGRNRRGHRGRGHMLMIGLTDGLEMQTGPEGTVVVLDKLLG